MFVKVVQNLHFSKFWNPEILLRFWDFWLNFCIWPLNIPNNFRIAFNHKSSQMFSRYLFCQSQPNINLTQISLLHPTFYPLPQFVFQLSLYSPGNNTVSLVTNLLHLALPSLHIKFLIEKQTDTGLQCRHYRKEVTEKE